MISKETLEEYFYYDESSPSSLRWKKDMTTGEHNSRKNARAGDEVGSWAASSYNKHNGAWITSLKKKRLKVHRIIYRLFYGDLSSDDVIDHVNGNPRDNKIENLRKVSQKVNMRNTKKRDNNTSGVTGVEFYDRPNRSPYFVACWRDNDGRKVSKSFATSVHGKEGAFIKAVLARNEALEALGDYTETHGRRK